MHDIPQISQKADIVFLKHDILLSDSYTVTIHFNKEFNLSTSELF